MDGVQKLKIFEKHVREEGQSEKEGPKKTIWRNDAGPERPCSGFLEAKSKTPGRCRPKEEMPLRFWRLARWSFGGGEGVAMYRYDYEGQSQNLATLRGFSLR